MRSWRSLNFEFSLAANLIDRCLVSKLLYKLISLDVNILLAWGRLRCLNVSCEELLCSFGSLLFKTLRVIFSLVCLEKLIRVSSSGNDHSSVGASTEHALVKGNVLWEVLLGVSATVRILILLFLGDDTRMCREALPASATGLLQHF